jgi:hypothetical protein
MTCLTSAPLQLAALHMGALHAHERLLVLLIAFGPFVVLVAVVLVLRRRDVAAEDRESGDQGRQAPAYERPESS